MPADENVMNFERGKTYTGYYEDSLKKVSVKIIKLTAQETIISCSSLWLRDKTLPTNKIFSIENGIEKLRFYNVYHKGCDSNHWTKWVTVYANNYVPEKAEEVCEKPFKVGMSYDADYEKHCMTPWGTKGSLIGYGQVKVKCIRRTKCYVWFDIPSQNRVAKMFIQNCRMYEAGVIPATREWKSLMLNSEYPHDE